MALEERHPDILQNIEFAIVAVYRENPDLRDADAIQALEALTKYFRQKSRGSDPDLPNDLSSQAGNIFAAVLDVLSIRDGLKEATPKRPSFSRAFREPSQEEIFLACLRKIEKSARRWNKRNGERGYLNFVMEYLP
jgi:hypothetical protein